MVKRTAKANKNDKQHIFKWPHAESLFMPKLLEESEDSEDTTTSTQTTSEYSTRSFSGSIPSTESESEKNKFVIQHTKASKMRQKCIADKLRADSNQKFIDSLGFRKEREFKKRNLRIPAATNEAYLLNEEIRLRHSHGQSTLVNFKVGDPIPEVGGAKYKQKEYIRNMIALKKSFYRDKEDLGRPDVRENVQSKEQSGSVPTRNATSPDRMKYGENEKTEFRLNDDDRPANSSNFKNKEDAGNTQVLMAALKGNRGIKTIDKNPEAPSTSAVNTKSSKSEMNSIENKEIGTQTHFSDSVCKKLVRKMIIIKANNDLNTKKEGENIELGANVAAQNESRNIHEETLTKQNSIKREQSLKPKRRQYGKENIEINNNKKLGVAQAKARKGVQKLNNSKATEKSKYKLAVLKTNERENTPKESKTVTKSKAAVPKTNERKQTRESKAVGNPKAKKVQINRATLMNSKTTKEEQKKAAPTNLKIKKAEYNSAAPRNLKVKKEEKKKSAPMYLKVKKEEKKKDATTNSKAKKEEKKKDATTNSKAKKVAKNKAAPLTRIEVLKINAGKTLQKNKEYVPVWR